jgi:hypothetical protein
MAIPFEILFQLPMTNKTKKMAQTKKERKGEQRLVDRLSPMERG